MTTLVLMRHGETEWSRENRFAGWSDIDLSARGEYEARRAGATLAANAVVFDRAYTSVLKRAWRTLDLALRELGVPDLSVTRTWRLNERHYGALQGRNRAEAAGEFGQDAIYQWRRAYAARPPALSSGDPRLPEFDPLYAGVDPRSLPPSESHRDTVERVIPFWEQDLAPQISAGARLLVVCHTSSIRAIVKIIEQIPDGDIEGFKIATAVPLVYELDTDLRVLSKNYLNTGLAGQARLLVSKIRPRPRSRWLG